MPRKKQKGPPQRSNRPGGPQAKQGHGKGQQQGGAGAASNSTQSKAGTTPGSGSGPQKLQSLQQNQRPIVPFLRGDRILLIGEGDFTFARSLAKQYKCRKLCATSYDSQETLYQKYPKVDETIQEILSSGSKSKSKSDSNIESDEKEKSQEEEEEEPATKSSHSKPNPKVLFSIDARKLGSQGGGGKEIKIGFPRRERKIPAWKLHQQQKEKEKHQNQNGAGKNKDDKAATTTSNGPWDVICFNFPHVGGLSTDVNRQVRSNQELLVSFFKACVPLLSAAPEPVGSDDEGDEEEGFESESESEFDSDSDDGNGDGDGDVQTTGKTTRDGPGQILVSLFEAEPYTLWNIKDLARHAGLQVVTSFRFPWSSYEGYSHARTLGEVEGKDGGRGGWRGEDRDARMYVFEVKKKEVKKGKKKRARDESSDSE